MEYDSRIWVSNASVSLICRDFQCTFRKSLSCFTDAAFLSIKNEKKTSDKKAVDLSIIIHQIFMRN